MSHFSPDDKMTALMTRVHNEYINSGTMFVTLFVTLCISAAANIHYISYVCKLLATTDLGLSVFYIVYHENHINSNYYS